MAGIEGVEKPWDYGWSSAKAYVEGVKDPLVTAGHNSYWSRWGNEDEERKKKYAAYILLDDAEDAKLFTVRTAGIGDDEFKARDRMNCGRPTTRCAGRPRKIQ